MDAKINIKYFNAALLDTRCKILPTSECYPVVEGMMAAVPHAVANATVIMEAKRFKGEPYPLHARYIDPLPPKGELVIYALIDPRNDTVFYVGQTSNLGSRLRAHLQFDTRYLHNPNRVDRRKLELIVNGQPIIAAVLCYPADGWSAEYLEALAIRAFHSTAQNQHRLRESFHPRYGRGR